VLRACWLFSPEIDFTCWKFGLAGIGVMEGRGQSSREGKAEIRTMLVSLRSLQA